MEKEPKLLLATIKNIVDEMEAEKKREQSNLGVLKNYISDLEQTINRKSI